jgi:hypothetical protein
VIRMGIDGAGFGSRGNGRGDDGESRLNIDEFWQHVLNRLKAHLETHGNGHKPDAGPCGL